MALAGRRSVPCGHSPAWAHQPSESGACYRHPRNRRSRASLGTRSTACRSSRHWTHTQDLREV